MEDRGIPMLHTTLQDVQRFMLRVDDVQILSRPLSVKFSFSWRKRSGRGWLVSVLHLKQERMPTVGNKKIKGSFVVDLLHVGTARP